VDNSPAMKQHRNLVSQGIIRYIDQIPNPNGDAIDFNLARTVNDAVLRNVQRVDLPKVINEILTANYDWGIRMGELIRLTAERYFGNYKSPERPPPLSILILTTGQGWLRDSTTVQARLYGIHNKTNKNEMWGTIGDHYFTVTFVQVGNYTQGTTALRSVNEVPGGEGHL
jgi:hypothetical protein